MTRQPRVLLDATAIPPNRAGVGRYVEELVRALRAQDQPVAVACQLRDAEHFAAIDPTLRIEAVPEQAQGTAQRMAWEQTGLPALARRVSAELVHSPHYTMPLASPVPVVVTLHDATFFSDPDVHVPVKRHFFRTWTRLSLRRAALCLAVSQASADELVTWAGADRRRLVVTPNGVDRGRFRPPAQAEIDDAAAHLGLTGRRYLAFLATLEPRKNVPALVRGFVEASRVWRERGIEPPALVLAGAPGWDTQVDPAIAAVPADLTVLKPGYLPLDLLPGYLAGAELVCYPSLGEGFGLPVLEAMASGGAVLTTRELALPEIGGDAVAYTGTSDAEIAASLVDLVGDVDALAELRRRGPARAALFDWSVTAERTREAYRAAVS